jgi:hypothetical protein
MELVMKSTIAALILTTLIATTFTQPAAAAAQRRHVWLGHDGGIPDYTQSGPNHTGPSFRGYPLSDWYIY